MNSRPREQHGHKHLKAGHVWRTSSISRWYIKIVHQMCQSGFSQVVLWNKESSIRIRCYTIIGVGEVRSKRELKDKKYIIHHP